MQQLAASMCCCERALLLAACLPAERATEAVKQTSLAVAATGVCYGLLRALYPLEGGV